MQALLLPFRGIRPQIHPSAFVAPGAVVIGDVVIGEESSVWPGAVLRGDMNPIRIGARTNVQDGTVIHTSVEGKGTVIGDGVTIGHMALIHDAELRDASFIGMKACVMDGAVVGEKAMLAAGALLTPGKTIPNGELWSGSPAKFWRKLGEEESAVFVSRAQQYIDFMHEYREALKA